MAHRDLREFIRQLEEQGELLRVRGEVDWKEEIGAVSRRLCDRETEGTNAPAVLFENIKGYPGGRFFTNTLASFRRYALALGLKKETPVKEIIETYRQRIKNPVKPKVVKSGPCKENILMGKDVDLFKFPTPKWHPEDGHRYIGTFHTVIVKDPDSDWVNWGLYRLGIHDEASTGIIITPNQHVGLIYEKYEARNQPMPVVVAIGQDPIHPIVAASGFMGGVSEVDMAGGLRQAPVELVKAETCDLLVPAHAEIILEGEILPKERKMEGPFGEYTGYYGGDRFPKPVFHVTCITHRNDPILTGSEEGVPLVDDNIMGCISQSALAKWLLLDLVCVPGVKDVFFLPHCASWHFCIVSATNAHPGIARRITSAIWGSKFGGIGGYADWVVIVDDDIDPTNIQQVLWSVATRCDPARGVQITERRGTNVLLPKIAVLDRTERGIQGSSIMIDAQFPYEWRRSDPASVARVANWDNWTPEVRERALKLLGEK
jgi:UbiD family decarboxylase